MTMFSIKLSSALSAAAFLATLAATPVMSQEIGEWDSDGDGVLNQDEFNEGWGSAYGDGESAFSIWDEDGDGALSEDEYNAGVFDSYDADDSGMIEEPEFGDVGDDMGDGGFWDV